MRETQRVNLQTPLAHRPREVDSIADRFKQVRAQTIQKALRSERARDGPVGAEHVILAADVAQRDESVIQAGGSDATQINVDKTEV